VIVVVKAVVVSVSESFPAGDEPNVVVLVGVIAAAAFPGSEPSPERVDLIVVVAASAASELPPASVENIAGAANSVSGTTPAAPTAGLVAAATVRVGRAVLVDVFVPPDEPVDEAMVSSAVTIVEPTTIPSKDESGL
jgi:hypothetical protein